LFGQEPIIAQLATKQTNKLLSNAGDRSVKLLAANLGIPPTSGHISRAENVRS